MKNMIKKLWIGGLLSFLLVFTASGFVSCNALEDIGGMIGGVTEPYSENIQYEPHGGYIYGKEVESYDVVGYKDGEAGGKVLKIPATYKDKPVVGIRGDAFKEQAIEKVILPSSIKSIGQRAFSKCLELKEVQLQKVEEILPRAFEYCTALTSIKFPSSLKKVNTFAFLNSGLRSVTIPKTVTYWGEAVFAACAGLETVTYEEGAVSTGKGLFSSCWSLKTVNLPNSIKKIEDNAFANTGIEEISLPDSVVEIGNGGFAQSYLKEINLNKVTIIGESAFEECKELERIAIPEWVDSLKTRTFKNCEKLSECTLPQNMLELGDEVFVGCKSLTKIVIPNGIEWIPASAFKDCESLTEVQLPQTLFGIGTDAFKNCIRLQSIAFPDGLTVIDDGSFYHCKSMVQIEIGEGLKTINGKPFDACPSLVEVINHSSLTLTAGAQDNGLLSWRALAILESKADSRWTKNGEYNFYTHEGTQYLLNYYGKEKEIALPTTESPYVIYTLAFAENQNLTKVVLSDSVTAIQYFAFADCGYLQRIEIPTSVTTIEEGAFEGCNMLTIYAEATEKPSGWILPAQVIVYGKENWR